MTGSVNEASAVLFHGDVDGNGSIDMKDVLNIRKAIANMIQVDEVLADANADETVDMKDVLFLRKYIAKMDIDLIPLPEESKDVSVEESQEISVTESLTTTSTTKAPVVTNTTKPPKYEISHDDPRITFIDEEGITLGTWLWNYLSSYQENGRDLLIDLMDKNEVTEVYFCCGKQLENSDTRADLHKFVSLVNQKGIRVDLLYDDQDLINGSLVSCAQNILTYRSEYPNDDFYGIHCDVEPTRTDKASTASYELWVKNYVDYFLKEVEKVQAMGFEVALDLGCGWLDYGRSMTYTGPIKEAFQTKVNPTQNADGSYTLNFFECVANTVDTMVMMSYNDNAEKIYSKANAGKNAANKAKTKIVYAVETMNSGEGDSVDFYNESKEILYTELSRLVNMIDSRKPEGGYGLAIHHTVSWYNLRDVMPEEKT